MLFLIFLYFKNIMEKVFIDSDINLMLVKASSFPEGIMAAHQALHTKITNDPNRMIYIDKTKPIEAKIYS
jgi:hypothetical protein